MKLKYVLGIFIPVFIIILFVFLASLATEVKVSFNINEQVKGEEIFGTPSAFVKIGEVTLENKYFLSQKYNLPRLRRCLQYESGKVEEYHASLSYDFELINGIYQFQSLQSYTQTIPANTKKTFSVGIQAQQGIPINYNGYNKYYIYNSEEIDSYKDCSVLFNEGYEPIAIIEINKGCEEYGEELRDHHLQRGTVIYHGKEYTEYCIDENVLLEYDCTGENYKMNMYFQNYSHYCNLNGYTGCKDGACY